jgi:hypothetical protein
MNNQLPEEPLHDDERLLDRLADGELDPGERQRLLSRLDRQPDGWRRCAVALLEAQCWRDEMSALTRQAAASRSPNAPSETRRTREGAVMRRPSGGRLVALAASLLVAFFCGLMVRDVWTEPGVSRYQAAEDADAPHGDSPSVPRDEPANRRGPLLPAEQEQHVVAEPSPAAQEVARDAVDDSITFYVQTGQGSATQRVRVPLVSANRIAAVEPVPSWLTPDRPPLPNPLMRQLEQTGHEVHWQRRYAPLQLDDGRKFVFPVDDLKITPVAFRPL